MLWLKFPFFNIFFILFYGFGNTLDIFFVYDKSTLNEAAGARTVC